MIANEGKVKVSEKCLLPSISFSIYLYPGTKTLLLSLSGQNHYLTPRHATKHIIKRYVIASSPSTLHFREIVRSRWQWREDWIKHFRNSLLEFYVASQERVLWIRPPVHRSWWSQLRGQCVVPRVEATWAADEFGFICGHKNYQSPWNSTASAIAIENIKARAAVLRLRLSESDGG